MKSWTITDQRQALIAIGKELVGVGRDSQSFNWKRARQLHAQLGEALRTDAQRQKRERFHERRAKRDAVLEQRADAAGFPASEVKP